MKTTLVWMSAAILVVACGSKIPGEDTVLETIIPVRGAANIGVSCSLGSVSTPKPHPLSLYTCETQLTEVQIVESMYPLVLQADCEKRTLSTRKWPCTASDTDCNIPWEVYPDNTFNIGMSHGFVRLATDGLGGTHCIMPVAIQMSGRLNCTNRDQLTIEAESTWRHDPTYRPAPGTEGQLCKLPASCEFRATTHLKQCQ